MNINWLKDKIVTTRKSAICSICCGDIKPKERVRSVTAIFDGRLFSYKWCFDCCVAMSKWDEDDGGSITMRYSLARKDSK